MRYICAARYCVRSGKDEEALAEFRKIPWPRAWDHFFKAIAQHRLGKADEARQSHDDGIAWIKSKVTPQFRREKWWEVIQLETLRREANQTLGIEKESPPLGKEVP